MFRNENSYYCYWYYFHLEMKTKLPEEVIIGHSYLGRPEEPRVPQDLKKNDMVYLIALLDHVL